MADMLKKIGVGLGVAGAATPTLLALPLAKIVTTVVKQVGEDTRLSDALPYVNNTASVFLDKIDPEGAERRRQKRLAKRRIQNAQDDGSGFYSTVLDLMDPSRREKRDNRAKAAQAIAQQANPQAVAPKVDNGKIAKAFEQMLLGLIDNVNANIAKKTESTGISNKIDALVTEALLKSAIAKVGTTDPAKQKFDNFKSLFNTSGIVTDKVTAIQDMIKGSEINLDGAKNKPVVIEDTPAENKEEKATGDLISGILTELQKHTVLLQVLVGGDKFGKIEAFRESKDQVEATSDTIQAGLAASVNNVSDEEKNEAAGGGVSAADGLSLLEVAAGGAIFKTLVERFPVLGKVFSKIPLLRRFVPAIGAAAATVAPAAVAGAEAAGGAGWLSRIMKFGKGAGRFAGPLAVGAFGLDAFMNATPGRADELFSDPTKTTSAGIASAIGNLVGGIPDALFGTHMADNAAHGAAKVIDAVVPDGTKEGEIEAIKQLEEDLARYKTMNTDGSLNGIIKTTEEAIAEKKKIVGDWDSRVEANQKKADYANSIEGQLEAKKQELENYKTYGEGDISGFTEPVITEINRLQGILDRDKRVQKFMERDDEFAPLPKNVQQRLEKTMEKSGKATSSAPVIIRGGDTVNNYGGGGSSTGGTALKPDHVKPAPSFEFWIDGGSIGYIPGA
jgi:hypothetical protein